MIEGQTESSKAVKWVAICPLGDILPNSGVAALVGGVQVAVFRLDDGALFAVSNYDPFSKANVLSRGIVGSRGSEPKVASPIFKQTFSLRTGECFEDASVRLATFAVRERAGLVEVSGEIT